MGLDMYLEAEHHLSGGWDHNRKDPNGKEVKQFDAALAVLGTDFATHRARYPGGNYIDLVFEVAYWRKANAIHAWFVRTVQDGKDECQRSYVDTKQLEELRSACQQILDTADADGISCDEDLARRLLPTQEGFFFGSQEYGRYYVQDLRDTVRQIDAVLSDPLNEYADLYYRSSW